MTYSGKRSYWIVLNFVIIIACVVTTGLCLRDMGGHRSLRQPSATPLEGQVISIPGADWSGRNQSMVIVMSTGCPFCSASAEFYKRLAAIAMTKHRNLAVALPQSIDQSREYLRTLHVPIKNVYQVSLDQLHIQGTPTVLVIDKRGRVIKAWLGRLGTHEEVEVVSALSSAS